MDVWQEGGLLGNTGTPRGVECNMRCHHHPLVFVLRFIVHNNGVDRFSLDPCWSHATDICHGIEMDFIGAAWTPQNHLGWTNTSHNQSTIVGN